MRRSTGCEVWRLLQRVTDRRRAAVYLAGIVAAVAPSMSAAQSMTGSNYTVAQNTAGNIATFTITNDYAETYTFYFRCDKLGKVSACQAPVR